jgi:hypothetical protein
LEKRQKEFFKLGKKIWREYMVIKSRSEKMEGKRRLREREKIKGIRETIINGNDVLKKMYIIDQYIGRISDTIVSHTHFPLSD